jgi:Cthe_2314-like HEPN
MNNNMIIKNSNVISMTHIPLTPIERIEIHLMDIEEILKREKLFCLTTDDYHSFLGINKFEEYNSRFEFNLEHLKLIRDTSLVTKDLMNLTTQLFIYLPYINNPLNEYIVQQGIKLFTYIQNYEDLMFSTYSSCCYEKLYNFWDRIGDRLNISFKLKINPYKVGFHSVMVELEKNEKITSNQHFSYLHSYWKNDFKEFNKIRKDIVHYHQIETYYSEEIIGNCRDEKKIIELWDWKRNLPHYFKNQLKNCCLGFYHMIMLENI